MNRRRMILFLIVSVQYLYGQSIEFGAGISKPMISVDDDFRSFNYAASDVGYNFFASFNDVNFGTEDIDVLKFRFTLGINTSSVEAFQRTGGQAGGTFTNVTTEKTVLTLGVYPLEFQLFKYIDVNIGFKYLRGISRHAIGSSSNFGAAGNAVTEFDGDIISQNQFGPTVRIAYKIKISEQMYLIPQYHYYIALSKEFNYAVMTRFVQNHFIAIGVEQKI